ncbi:MBL fold metallo-hydrolase [Actinomyces lilanjuaniae]|uniref:MBL fold metallo-hydrolase n=1 Tax=Actinomyces lilanjuaniae TaxID=2321394 RepID=A0ABN5PR63_9ACTO|nr:MBL fold metallo-hydrolase [Actinomyces lilanjuaniae]AYD90519.1 MBL fold metallo-hydrolase [Actinomyces lilanjuaniae]
MSRPPADSRQLLAPGFTDTRVNRHITRIHDPRDVHMYLVTGRERALLVDTGYGVGDLAAFVTSLTDLPLTVVLTHGHIDHAFGASGLTDVHMHPADLPVLARHQVASRRLHNAVRSAHAGTPGDAPAPVLAPEVDPTRLVPLHDGERIGLGGLTVEVLEAPGHTPGSVALLVEEERVLITGDAANQLTFLFLPESSTLTSYAAMLERLTARAARRYDRVLVSHGSGEITPTVLEDLRTLCERVLAGDDDAVPFRFEDMGGLVARAVTRSHGDPGPPADDAPNIVYDPHRL